MASTTGIYKCCNPLKLENHNVKKGLRLASKQLQDLWNLDRFHYLCTPCRKKLSSLKSVSSPPNDSSNNDVNEDEHDNEDNGVRVAESDNFSTTASISSSNSFSSG